MKHILPLIVGISAFLFSISDTYASFTLSGTTQTKVTNAITGFPTSYRNELISETIAENGLNQATYSGVVATYAQFFGNSTIGDTDVSTVAREIFPVLYGDIDGGVVIARGLDNNLYAVIDNGTLSEPILLTPASLTALSGNLIYKKAVDVLLSTKESVLSDGTTDTNGLLSGYRIFGFKDLSQNVSSGTMNFLFQVKDSIGRRFFNVSK